MLKVWHVIGQQKENLYWLFYLTNGKIYLFDFTGRVFVDVITTTDLINLPIPKDLYRLKSVSRNELRTEWGRVFSRHQPPFELRDIIGFC